MEQGTKPDVSDQSWTQAHRAGISEPELKRLAALLKRKPRTAHFF
jgi:hypothetical protein